MTTLHINSEYKRGFFNIVGKSLKIIAESIDSDDVQKMRETISKIHDNEQATDRTINNEVQFIQQIYRSHNDILLLNSHVEDIGQIIFSCKLGVIPADILAKKEIDLITDFDSYSTIKIVVLFQNNNIILTLLIRQFSSNVLSIKKFEALPNIQNKSIVLNQTETLVYSNNNIYYMNI